MLSEKGDNSQPQKWGVYNQYIHVSNNQYRVFRGLNSESDLSAYDHTQASTKIANKRSLWMDIT